MKPVNLLFSAVQWHLSISENLALVVLVFWGGDQRVFFDNNFPSESPPREVVRSSEAWASYTPPFWGSFPQQTPRDDI